MKIKSLIKLCYYYKTTSYHGDVIVYKDTNGFSLIQKYNSYKNYTMYNYIINIQYRLITRSLIKQLSYDDLNHIVKYKNQYLYIDSYLSRIYLDHKGKNYLMQADDDTGKHRIMSFYREKNH